MDETSLILVDKSRPTCASALLDGDLNQLKTLCFYEIHRVPYPRSAHRIEDNRFILTNTSRKLATLVFGLTGPRAARALPAHIGLRCAQARPALRADQSHNCPQTNRPIFIMTNITQLQLLCAPPNGSEIAKHVINLQQVQSVHDFSCRCTYIAADEFKLTTDLTYCDQAHNIDSVVQVKFPVNLPYLTEYFDQQDLVNILVDTLSNDSHVVRVPNLALKHGAELDALFAQQEKGS